MDLDSRQHELATFAFGFAGERAKKTRYGLGGNLALFIKDSADEHYMEDAINALTNRAQKSFPDFKGYRVHNIVFDAEHPIKDPHICVPNLFLQAAPELCEAITDIKEDDLVRDIAFVHGLPEQNKLYPGNSTFPIQDPITGEEKMMEIPQEHRRGDVYQNISLFRERIFWEKPVLWVFVMNKEDFGDFARQTPDTSHWITNKVFLPLE